MKLKDASATAERLLPTWERFNSDFVTPALPVYCVVRRDPLVRLFVSANATSIGCAFAALAAEATPSSLLTEITVRDLTEGGERLIEISTGSPGLYRHFYALLECVCDSVVREEVAPQVALSRALRDWQSLLRSTLLLTEERQAGLFGELWMLNRLTDVYGASVALDGWVGPLAQAHDFRIGGSEFEVKTATGERRRHYINGLNQLRASPQKLLYLVSVHLTRAGAVGGDSLPELALKTQDRMEDGHGNKDKFLMILETRLGFRREHYDLYGVRWHLRSRTHIIPVADGCPRLVPEAIASLPEGFAVGRIGDVTYRIDVDGMGHVDGSAPFLAILPDPSLEGANH